MNISLSSINYNPDGSLFLNASIDSTTKQMTRRVSKTRTLDGGVVINDFGAGEADPDFQITLENPTAKQVEVIRYFLQYETVLTLSTNEGFFLVSPSEFSDVGGKVQLTLLVKEKHQ